jgi:hypothetical protein
LRKGFVLLIVMMILGMMGVEMFVLSSVSNKITFQTSRAYLEAVEQNLVSSGLAWAKHNMAKEAEKIELDTADIAPQNAQLIVTAGKQSLVTINTSCSRSGQNLRHNKSYYITSKVK